MNYKLAKQLHDAHYGCIGPHDEPHRCSALHCNHCGLCSPNKEDWEFPELSELIDACGERFASIRRLRNRDWCATGLPNKVFGKVPQVICENLEEAVAKLWLKLNETNSTNKNS